MQSIDEKGIQSLRHVGATASPHIAGEHPPGPINAAKLATLERSGGHAHGASHLLTDREAARVLGVGDRTFADLITTADWLPLPIILGARLRRWDADELLDAVRTRAPRGGKGPEPSQLVTARRARIEKMKAGAGAEVSK